MKRFRRALELRNSSPDGRRWIYVPYDQLSHQIGPLAELDPAEAGIILVESPWKAARRPYHRQKLALILANQRQFALEQAERGVAVRYVAHDGPYRDALRPLAAELGPLRLMRPAERELRVDLAPLVGDGLLEVRPHGGWLTTAEQSATPPAPSRHGGWTPSTAPCARRPGCSWRTASRPAASTASTPRTAAAGPASRRRPSRPASAPTRSPGRWAS